MLVPLPSRARYLFYKQQRLHTDTEGKVSDLNIIALVHLLFHCLQSDIIRYYLICIAYGFKAIVHVQRNLSKPDSHTHTEHVWIKLKKLDHRKKWTRNITRERISQVLL